MERCGFAVFPPMMEEVERKGSSSFPPMMTVSKNPFNVRKDRSFHPLQKGQTLSACKRSAAETLGICEENVALAINGKYIDTDNLSYLIMPGDNVYAYPQVGGFISIPMIITGLIVGAVMTGVSMGLSYLMRPDMGSLMPPPTASNPYMSGTDAKGLKGTLSYAYAGTMNARQPGFPIPVLYGKMRLGVNIINNYLETYGRNDILYALGGLCEGPVSSIAPTLDEVWINNEQKLSETQGTCSVELGSASPTISPYFGDLHQVREINTRIRECTKLLLKFDASPFVDSSIFERTVTTSGVTQSTAKFGAYAGYWDQVQADYLSLANDTLWELGTDDFTIDFWFTASSFWPGSNRNLAVCSFTDPVGYAFSGWRMRCDFIDSGAWASFVLEDSGGMYIGSRAFQVDTTGNTYYHVAVTRHGNRWYWFVNGEDYTSNYSIVSPEDSFVVPTNTTPPLLIGEANGLSNFMGKIDEFHFYKGQPLYTKDFSNSLPGARESFSGLTVVTRGDVDKISIHLNFPYGLYHVDDDGSLSEKEVEVKYRFREEGSTWFEYEGTSHIIAAATRSPIKHQFDLPLEVIEYTPVSGTFTVGDDVSGASSGSDSVIIADDTDADKLYIRDKNGDYTATETITDESGGTATVDAVNYNQKSKYELQIWRLTEDDYDSKDQSVMVWGHVDEVYRKELGYPFLASIGIYLPASDKVQGVVQSVSTVVDRGSITMPQWTANGGGTVSRDTSNPAWAALDMLTNTRYGGGVDVDNLDKTSWEAWATYCDVAVASKTRAKFNGVFDSAVTLGEALEVILKIGRAMITRVGKTYYIVIDQPANPVQLFSVGNIQPGSLKTRFLTKKNRPHAITVEYLDEDNEYERRSVTVRREDFDYTTEPLRSEKEFLIGCTTEDQATRHAFLRLQMANGINRTIDFEVGVDAVACEPGDVVQVQHDSNALTYGGRVVSATSSTITLDRNITLAESTYDGVALLLVRLSDDTLVEKEITGPWDTETNTFNISGTFSTIPSAKDVYGVGRSVLDVFEYRVTQMERTSELLIKISGSMYYEDGYYHDNYESGTKAI